MRLSRSRDTPAGNVPRSAPVLVRTGLRVQKTAPVMTARTTQAATDARTVPLKRLLAARSVWDMEIIVPCALSVVNGGAATRKGASRLHEFGIA